MIKRPEAQGERSRLLIVDDEPANLQLMAGILHEEYTVIAATNGKKALELARAQHAQGAEHLADRTESLPINPAHDCPRSLLR